MTEKSDGIASERHIAARRFRLLWIGRAGFGVVWRGVEHQFYRDLDGSMGGPWTHQNNGRWTADDERRLRGR